MMSNKVYTASSHNLGHWSDKLSQYVTYFWEQHEPTLVSQTDCLYVIHWSTQFACPIKVGLSGMKNNAVNLLPHVDIAMSNHLKSGVSLWHEE
jgi:hypothetical protein